MAFGLALSYYRNALFEQTLESIGHQNNDLRRIIVLGYRDLEYYRSAQYKDKYAKENLGLTNPGEKVLILNKPATPVIEDDALPPDEREQREAAYFELLRQMPVLEHWNLYFFHKEKIEELRRAI